MYSLQHLIEVLLCPFYSLVRAFLGSVNSQYSIAYDILNTDPSVFTGVGFFKSVSVMFSTYWLKNISRLAT